MPRLPEEGSSVPRRTIGRVHSGPAGRAARPAGVRVTRTLVAGIHAGRSGCTVVVRDAVDGELVRRGRADYPDGRALDPHAWWDGLLAAIAASGGFADVSAFGVGASLPGLVAMDDTGHPIEEATRPWDAETARSSILDDAGVPSLLSRIGSLPEASGALVRLRALRLEHPEAAERVEAVALPHDWLTWRLRGFGPADEMPNGLRLEELVTDRSDASTTGYWSAITGKWDHALFDEALGKPAIKPRIMPPDAWGGESWKMPSHGIKSERVISIGGAAPALAALRLEAAPGDVLVLAGRTGVATVVEAGPDGTDVAAGHELTWRADATGRFLPTVLPTDQAGPAVEAAPAGTTRNTRGPEADAEDGVSAGTAEVDVPVSRSPASLAAAVDELRIAGLTVARIVLPGSAAVRPGLQERIAAACGVPVVLAAPGDLTADGAAAQAVWAKTHRRARWPSTLRPDTAGADPAPQTREAAMPASTPPAR